MFQHMDLYIFDAYKLDCLHILNSLNTQVYSLEDFQSSWVNMNMMVLLRYHGIHYMDHKVKVYRDFVGLLLQAQGELKFWGGYNYLTVVKHN